MLANLASWAAAGSAVAAIAAAVNTVRTSSAARELGKTQILFTMAEQWNHLYHNDRIEGDAFVAKHPELELPSSYDEALTDIAPVYRVFGFFELLQTSIEFKLIPEKKALEMFLYYFVWWDTVCAKAKYPVRWDRFGRLKHLRQSSQKMRDYEQVKEWTLRDLEHRLAARGVSEMDIAAF